jgi:hypothetical protein
MTRGTTSLPKVGSQSAAEDRLRDALRSLLDRFGLLPTSWVWSLPQDELDRQMIRIAAVATLRREEFAVCPELDQDIKF